MKRSKALLLVMTLFAVLLVPAAPASAADSHICTYLASPTTSWKAGTIRKLGSGTQNIAWSTFTGTGCTATFPSGGNISVSVRFYNKSGSNCTSTKKSDGTTIATYTGLQQSKYIATSVLGTTCWAVRWKANNSNSTGVNHYGKIFFVNA